MKTLLCMYVPRSKRFQPRRVGTTSTVSALYGTAQVAVAVNRRAIGGAAAAAEVARHSPREMTGRKLRVCRRFTKGCRMWPVLAGIVCGEVQAVGGDANMDRTSLAACRAGSVSVGSAVSTKTQIHNQLDTSFGLRVPHSLRQSREGGCEWLGLAWLCLRVQRPRGRSCDCQCTKSLTGAAVMGLLLVKLQSARLLPSASNRQALGLGLVLAGCGAADDGTQICGARGQVRTRVCYLPVFTPASTYLTCKLADQLWSQWWMVVWVMDCKVGTISSFEQQTQPTRCFVFNAPKSQEKPRQVRHEVRLSIILGERGAKRRLINRCGPDETGEGKNAAKDSHVG
ncbi:hypothetical protein B0T17DRAFT_511531 [Bombardia bombarda]|uniref:Uncharacterized protein n=1 Tax=Bombardia bombarda TaxID=252184 RepID=A0AA39TPE7_9PEZI|nr:hypothetical protein B0T17DRAFT_511531 [Bombardia bombarda]